MARFSLLRTLVTKGHGFIFGLQNKKIIEYNESILEKSLFKDVDIERVVDDLKRDGVAFGIKLPKDLVTAIRSYAENAICYADRDSTAGFKLCDREVAEKKMGKKILVAQYFNTVSECPEIKKITLDPVLNIIACKYLQSKPTLVGTNLWWTFPVDASNEDRVRHAHVFHRDVDDFKFFKFFFYLTDVDAGDGAHVCVLGSQGAAPSRHAFDRWSIRRYRDQEVEEKYSSEKVKEVVGEAGDGFAEDTWCVHKGTTPVTNPRLLLQIQFALFDYGAMHDRRDKTACHKLT
jgi:hypothetical protein